MDRKTPHREYNKKNLVIYHGGNCSDGFGAAYAAWKQLGDTADYVPMVYGEDFMPSFKDKNVYILDFSFPKDIYEDILKQADKVKLLDHHKTAMQSLCGCKGCFFDLNKSGAVLAWEHFNPHKPVPQFIRLIQDGDLWKFKYPETKPFYSAVNMIEKRFALWSQFEDENYLKQFIENGKLILQNFEMQLKDMIKEAKPVSLLGHQGLMINATGAFASDLGNMLSEKSGTFALVWYEKKDGIKCSLRSVSTFDCSTIAQAFGGGGHPQACAFNLKDLNELDYLLKHGELALPQKPHHEHDSSTSIYLASEKYNGTIYDFYYAPQSSLPTVIARYGKGGDYISGLSFVKSSLHPGENILTQLKEIKNSDNETLALLSRATLLSIEKGLLNEKLEGIKKSSPKL